MNGYFEDNQEKKKVSKSNPYLEETQTPWSDFINDSNPIFEVKREESRLEIVTSIAPPIQLNPI